MKIAKKISLAFLVTAIILTTLAGCVFYFIAKNSLQHAIYAHLNTAIRSREEHVKTYLEMLKSSVAQLSKSIVLENFLKMEKDSPKKNEALDLAIKRLINTKAVTPSVYEFLLLDKIGKVVASSDAADIGLDKSSDAFFVEAQKDAYIKDAYYSEATHKPLIAASAPLSDSETDEFLGVIVARVELNDLYKIVTESTGLGQTGEIYIVNKDGFMITPSRFLKDTFLKQKVDTLNFRNSQLHKNRAFVPTHEEIITTQDYRGTIALGTHEYVSETQWSLLGEIDRREAFAPLVKIRIIFWLILFFTPLAAWLIGLVLQKIPTQSKENSAKRE